MSAFEKYVEEIPPPVRADAIRQKCGMLDEDEMAATLGVSQETLATWRTKKRGPPFVKIGKKVFYLLADFALWVSREGERQQNAPLRAHKRRKTQKQTENTDYVDHANEVAA